MKSFPLTVGSVILLFALIMTGVAIYACSQKSHICKIDPALIQQMRK